MSSTSYLWVTKGSHRCSKVYIHGREHGEERIAGKMAERASVPHATLLPGTLRGKLFFSATDGKSGSQCGEDAQLGATHLLVAWL
jgi:hypothetical protein